MCVVKLLKWVAVTINSLLLVAGIIIAIFGVILWKTDMNAFGDEIVSKIPTDLRKEVGKPPEVPPLFIWLGKLVMAFGLFIIGLSIIGIFAMTCCADKCKICLIIYLVILIVLAIVQGAIVALSYNTSTLELEVEKALKPVFTDEAKREKASKFILGTEMFFKCCAVTGYIDYYCDDIYDSFCNFGCNKALTLDPIKGSSTFPLCALADRKAQGKKKTTGVCAASAAKTEKKGPFVGEPIFADIAGLNAEIDFKSLTKPSELPGCATKVFEGINGNLKYVQITCIVILCIELFCMLVVIILICKNKSQGGK